ncbi:hypothetical protein [Microseira sp. BLCC-F43]|jgi:hypothetical protein|uniref:hypothetical protein n=1 Tax=Microseira sp. BLCC-F43 TaxID=3153602 RepID=UPI0035B9A330
MTSLKISDLDAGFELLSDKETFLNDLDKNPANMICGGGGYNPPPCGTKTKNTKFKPSKFNPCKTKKTKTKGYGCHPYPMPCVPCW